MSAATTVGNVAGFAAIGTEEAVLTAELQAGSEEAFALLIAQYHAQVYSLVSRVLNDPSDAPDITQDVFIKIFRGIRSFHGDSSLRTWIYRIALREASNQRRWWSRHRGREVTIEAQPGHDSEGESYSLKEVLVDEHASPFENAVQDEMREQVEMQLRRLPENFRTVVVLRDLEGMSYDEIADILGTQLGTVKSRLVRGRAMLRERLGKLIAPAAKRPGAVSTRKVEKEAGPKEAVLDHFEEAV